MTTSSMLLLGKVLALLAVCLIGFAGYQMWNRIQTLETAVADYEEKLDEYASDRGSFEIKLRSEAFGDGLASLVATQDADARRLIATKMLKLMDGVWVQMPEGQDLRDELYGIADESDPEIREQLEMTFREVRCLECGGLVPPDFLPVPVAQLVETLTATVGAGLSGILALLTFLRSGSRRKLEDELLSMDVELKRIEVAAARHAAQEAFYERA